jgi:hypothetical protein
MLGALSTSGNYQPNYLDYQTFITWKLPRNREPGTKPWTMSFLGNVSQNDYRFQPDSLSESFGGQDAKNLSIYYEGQEKDRFLTAFAALSAKGKVSDEVQIGFDLSGFYTNERENFDITGEYVLSNAPAGGKSSNVTTEQITPGEGQTAVLGTGIFHQHARNSLQAGVIALAHHGDWTRGANTLSWGVSGQAELITDRINEWEWRDSAGYSMPNDGQTMELYYAMRGYSSMRTARVQAYIQNQHRWQVPSGQWILTVGGRLQWWSWNNEVLPSPRASVEWIPGWKRDFCFRLATGLYYQAPFYKELRDTSTVNGITYATLNKKIKSQRSIHFIAGYDHTFRMANRKFKFTAEAYYKMLSQLVPYSVNNVKVVYYGENEASGHAAGLDLKLYGEFVEGTDSWLSLSLMDAKMKLNGKSVPLPTDQRIALSLFFTDYFPGTPRWKLSLRLA